MPPARMSLPFAGLLAGSVAGCAPPAPEPPGGADVACLERQVTDMHLAYYRALTVCHSPAKPDLTGDEKLQQYALYYRLPFTIRPKADAALKAEHPFAVTGTRIAGADPGF